MFSSLPGVFRSVPAMPKWGLFRRYHFPRDHLPRRFALPKRLLRVQALPVASCRSERIRAQFGSIPSKPRSIFPRIVCIYDYIIFFSDARFRRCSGSRLFRAAGQSSTATDRKVAQKDVYKVQTKPYFRREKKKEWSGGCHYDNAPARSRPLVSFSPRRTVDICCYRNAILDSFVPAVSYVKSALTCAHSYVAP